MGDTRIGTIQTVDVMDQGASIGVGMTLADGRGVYLRLPRRNIGMRGDIDAARRHGTTVMVACEPLPPRLGAPAADIVGLAIAA